MLPRVSPTGLAATPLHFTHVAGAATRNVVIQESGEVTKKNPIGDLEASELNHITAEYDDAINCRPSPLGRLPAVLATCGGYVYLPGEPRCHRATSSNGAMA
jgi:hypothetical protein